MKAFANFSEFVTFLINELINNLVLFVIALTVITIIWQVTKTWIIGTGEEKSIQDGKHVILAAVLVMVIIISIWGILNLLQASLFPS